MSEPQSIVETCTYWQLTPEERAEVIATAPIQQVWSLEMERRDDGYWQFSIPELKTINELMVGGTEELLDYNYTETCGVEPDASSRMTVSVSAEPMSLATTILHKVADDPNELGGATYEDIRTGENGWLCAWTRVCFGTAPEYIYVLIEPTM